MIMCGNGQSALKQEAVSQKVPDVSLQSNKDQLQGIWGIDTVENAIFEIKGDSIIYTEHRDTPYYFQTIGDSITIDVDGFKLVWVVKQLQSDSLVVTNQVGVTTSYVRFLK
jgi:hypothetical protein